MNAREHALYRRIATVGGIMRTEPIDVVISVIEQHQGQT